MRFIEIMNHNKDTTVWSGISVLLALANSPEMIKQAVVVILFPTLGWLLMYLVKKAISYFERNKEDENNSK